MGKKNKKKCNFNQFNEGMRSVDNYGGASKMVHLACFNSLEFFF